jgi:nitrogen-specific signal transduction histidine kinase/ActR/RegA family two-component response regulator
MAARGIYQYDPHGKPERMLGILMDITERKRFEAQFRQAQKMEAIGALAGGVAHDFNNLLTVILGSCNFLLQDLSPGSMRSDVEQIKKAGERAVSLTQQLLAFSRKQVLQPKILDLNDLVAETEKMLRRLIGEDIDLLTVPMPGLGLVKADPGQIQQVIMNLAVNARDAMPEGGKLTIETENVDIDQLYLLKHPEARIGRYVMLAVSDNGIGMDRETRARIFEPFFSTKEPGKGTGLGLATVYGIVKQSDGFIYVYSEPGKGATFKIYVPRVEGEAVMPSGGGKEETESPGTGTVLVVEDESAVRGVVARVLRGKGYAVIEASDGAEALRAAREFSGEIHLVLTDVVMPGMSGRELISQIKAVRPGIKALFVSGYTGNAIVHHGILDSGVAFLQKPFTDDSLARKVREMIASGITR